MKPTILLVEDNEDDAFFLQRALRKAHVDNPLHVLGDGQNAKSYLEGSGIYADRTQFPVPLAVFLDLNLPRVSGLQLLKWIRGQSGFEQIRVIVLTSSYLDTDLERAYDLGADSFLVKTGSQEQLVAMVRSVREILEVREATETEVFA